MILLMKKLLGIMAMVMSLSGNTYADNIYNGRFVDAHSKVGSLISDEQVSKQIFLILEIL